MEEPAASKTAKLEYRAFAEGNNAVPLYHQPWWLDATCGSVGWDVALVTRGNEIHGALPFVDRRKMGFRTLDQPGMTPFLGPWVKDTGAGKAKTYDRQKEILTALIDALPRHHHYAQTWSPAMTNWLPFYWRGFKQTTLYTYVLQNIADEDDVWNGLRANIKTDVRKARGKFGVTVEMDAAFDDFLALNGRTFSRQGKSVPYSQDVLRTLDAACAERSCRRILIARDQDGRPHAGVYLVWDADSAYYLMGGGDPELRNSGATSLCMWEAIRYAATVSKKFNFEGSMIEPIERFFRAFGGEQVPYFKVERTNSPAYSALKWLRSRISGS